MNEKNHWDGHSFNACEEFSVCPQHRTQAEDAHWEAFERDDQEWAYRERMGEDEAWECGELAAMRREAEREAKMEAAMAQAEEDEWIAEDIARYPGGRCATDGCGRVQCKVYDPIPF